MLFVNCFLAFLLIIGDTENVNAKSKALTTESNSVVSKVEGKRVTKLKEYNNGIRQSSTDYFEKEIISEKNDTIEFHEMTTDYIIPQAALDDKETSNLSGLFSLDVYASSGSDKKSDSDKTGTIKCSSTVSYTITKSNGKEYLKLVKASGNLKSLTGHAGSSQGGGISITSNDVVIGCYGVNTSEKYVSNSKSISCLKKPCSWSHSPSWTKVGYSSGTGVYKAGCQQSVSLKRGNSKWTFTLSNYIN